MNTPSPRLHLAIDNCIALKRWTEPTEWMQIAADADIYCVEASADNECDPLYNTPDTITDWLNTVKDASEKTGVKVVNFYSGHGTYTTLGLAHTDPRVRDHIQHNWLEVMIDNAAELGAGLGFFCHAFAQSILKSPQRYADAETDLYRRLAELARYAAAKNVQVSVEQMYTPHQIPWTVAGADRLLTSVYGQAQAPMYITLDTGHAVGQIRYTRPGADAITAYVDALRAGKTADKPWLGYAEVNMPDQQSTADIVSHVEAQLEETPYLFAQPEDGDIYHWLRQIGPYSPILHLQQTDGTKSAHQPFNETTNAAGIITGQKVLAALADAYDTPERQNILPRCEDIYLTIEVFSSTMDRPEAVIQKVNESAAYWRQFIPRDGITLDEAINVTA